MQWRPLRRALGITGFAVNAYTGEKAGDQVIELHDETSAGAGGHEELYLVLSGRAELIVDEDRIDAPAGTMVRVDLGAWRQATASEDETTVLVIGGVPGSALPVSPFEYWYAAQGPNARGDYEQAIAVASEGLADYPEHPSLHYQLACFNALAGHRDRALDHFEIAAIGNPEVIEWAAGDADLDSIREHARFHQATRTAASSRR